jgi:hypothetical protein
MGCNFLSPETNRKGKSMTAFIAGLVYRAFGLTIGTVFAFLGYKLFNKGVFAEGSDMNMVWGDRKLLLKRAAPGTMFALFGVLVIALATYKDITFEEKPSAPKLTNDQQDMFERLANNRFLQNSDREKLVNWLNAMTPGKTLTFSLYRSVLTMNMAAKTTFEKLIAGSDVSPSERCVAAEWYAVNAHVPEIPTDVDRSLQTMFIKHQKLSAPEQDSVRDWLKGVIPEEKLNEPPALPAT